MSVLSNNRDCLWCGKSFRGRADKKYCDDNCRNAYHNQRLDCSSSLVRHINKALVRNRHILATIHGQAGEQSIVPQELLLQQGFQFKYHTQSFLSPDGKTFFCCYDYAYLRLQENESLLITKFENSLTAWLSGR